MLHVARRARQSGNEKEIGIIMNKENIRKAFECVVVRCKTCGKYASAWYSCPLNFGVCEDCMKLDRKANMPWEQPEAAQILAYELGIDLPASIGMYTFSY